MLGTITSLKARLKHYFNPQASVPEQSLPYYQRRKFVYINHHDVMKETRDHFGGSEYFSIFNIEDNKIVSEEIIPTPEHITGSFPNFLAEQKITDIVVGGIGGKAIEIFNNLVLISNCHIQ